MTLSVSLAVSLYGHCYVELDFLHAHFLKSFFLIINEWLILLKAFSV